ncbi:Bug family tripartite tricarboxylate transporter substrate binding protein [Billgrantia desiderata]|uniref:Bug family tripartite tricarboxylate transporter substrate binding protein n=1 Tax=Billgrantia desiderata TaxID=52021 RepID=UPI00089E0B7F|nr:tripartite tricarboxylate transporter substrate binding protein [Halomonas desiderata]SEF83095.1 Tripartite-type tricarboxylate transporter, receptor component TctC [Halomonas desiderata]
MKKTMIALSLAVGAAGFTVQSLADSNYPERNIEFIVPWNAGGGADNVVRALQNPVEEVLGTNIVVRNLSGGGGAVGFSRALSAKPDGYVVTIPTNATFTLEGLGNVDFTYTDFEYIARVLVEPYVLAVNSGKGWETLEDLVDHLQENDARLMVGASGVGSSTHVMAVALAEELGVEFDVVPYDSGANAVTAAMGGHIDAVVLNPSEVVSGIESGRLTALVTTGDERSGAISQAPTMLEEGYDFSVSQWRGVAAPKGISQEVEDRWVEAIQSAVESPEFQRAAEMMGSDIMPLYGDELDEFVERTARLMIDEAAKLRQ